MSVPRIVLRAFHPANLSARRSLATCARRLQNSNPGNAQEHTNTDAYRQAQKEKETNPHMTNTNSTLQEGMPKVGAFTPPPEMISQVAPGFAPRDSVRENTERMMGGSQDAGPEGEAVRIRRARREIKESEREWSRQSTEGGVPKEAREAIGLGEVAEGGEGYKGGGSYVNHTDELQVGELEGGSFKIEPLLRTGEDAATMRARLLCKFLPFLSPERSFLTV